MKYLLLLLLPFNLFAYESVEEIDALDGNDFLQQLLPKDCRSQFKDGEARILENLDMLAYGRKNCEGKGIIDSVASCDDVSYTCVKPSQVEMDGFFEAFKVNEKAKLAVRLAQKAADDARQNLRDRNQSGENLNLLEINEVLRK